MGTLQCTRWDGQAGPVLEPGDLAFLSIRKGSLSEPERREIESHVTHTYDFLARIPWTPDLAGIPGIAYAHHERPDGQGYPRRLQATDIPVQSRAMAIADIFDALTAQDRPYKAAVPLSRSLDILRDDARAGHLDPDLLDIFVEARACSRRPSAARDRTGLHKRIIATGTVAWGRSGSPCCPWPGAVCQNGRLEKRNG